MSTTWEHIAADKRGRIDKCIPPEWKISVSAAENSVIGIPASSGVLSPQELKITESTASELVPRLAKGELKAVDVTLAFCKRAALAHQLVSFRSMSLDTQEPKGSYVLRTYLTDKTDQLRFGIIP